MRRDPDNVLVDESSKCIDRRRQRGMMGCVESSEQALTFGSGGRTAQRLTASRPRAQDEKPHPAALARCCDRRSASHTMERGSRRGCGRKYQDPTSAAIETIGPTRAVGASP